MKNVYITPQYVNPTDAKLVLDFLNEASSAQVIADKVELPGEPDVGIITAQHIIDRRNSLGGFTTLQQVFEVPQIGLERFTEIVYCIAGRISIVQSTSEPQPITYDVLFQELMALKETVHTIQSSVSSRNRVTLRQVFNHQFVGQTITLEAKVLSSNHLPLAGVPITLFATWGQLHCPEGFGTTSGNSITVKTGVNGTVRFTLTIPSPEKITLEQQAALESQLTMLDPNVLGPTQLQSAFSQMAKQYAWDGNGEFQTAVDILFGVLKDRLCGVNPVDAMSSWNLIESTVFAHIREKAELGGDSSFVESTAALTLALKDWVGPFMQTCFDEQYGDTSLDDQMKTHKDNHSNDPSSLLGKLQEDVNNFVLKRKGVLGEHVGRNVAQKKLHNFIASDTSELSVGKSASLLSTLATTSNAVRATSIGVMAAIGSTDSGIRKDLSEKINQVAIDSDPSTLMQQVEQISEELHSKATKSYLDTELGKKASQSYLDTELGKKASQSYLDTELGKKASKTYLDTELGKKVDSTQLDALETSITQTINSKVSSIESSLSNKLDVTSFGGLDAFRETFEKIDVLTGKVDELEKNRRPIG